MQARPGIAADCAPSSITALIEFVRAHPRLLVLTGAGVSVSSGIPTYRDRAGVWSRSTPIQHRDFLQHRTARQRYWARSFAGWPAVQAAQPNAAHHALVQLETAGHIDLLVTQNIDRLHQRAGQRQALDLHGRMDRVLCMDCGARTPRADLQVRLARLNPHLSSAGSLAPDGDADVPDALIAAVTPPDCLHCGGLLKPDVVFFGDSVDRALVERINAAIVDADAMLVVGSSLMVYSGFRFCRHAAQQGIPLACINPGATRADALIDLKVTADAAPVLARLAAGLSCPGATDPLDLDAAQAS